MPTVGKRQMIACGNGWMVVGDVVAQTGAFSFDIANGFIICNTGGVPWDVLADDKKHNDKGREAATYRRWSDDNDLMSVGPQFGPCRAWKGELPVVRS